MYELRVKIGRKVIYSAEFESLQLCYIFISSLEEAHVNGGTPVPFDYTYVIRTIRLQD